MNRPDPILTIQGLTAGYNVVPVIQDLSLQVGRGEAVALLGANGAGKSTLLKTISGLIKPMRGTVFANGAEVQGRPPEALVRDGISHVAEGRRIFRKMSVEANLEIGLAAMRLARDERARRFEEQYTLFPILREKARQAADALSGGQQQMLAIAQALIRQPTILMLDEPSTGLAPIMIEEVFATLETIRKRGVSILLVEQVVERTLEFVDYGYLIQGGHIRDQGTPAELIASDAVRKAYLGEAAE